MLKASITIAFTLLSACGPNSRTSPLDLSRTQEAWNPANDPANLRDRFELKLSKLPLAAELERKPWTDTYWPSHRAGIADRWHASSRPDPFPYELNDRARIARMSEAELAELSPAEKYDVFAGRYDYPLVREERDRTSPEDPSWFGLCHGWAPASINFNEPKPVTLEGAGGVRVPFGSSDVKALLTFAQQYGMDSGTVGERCNENSGDGNECRDVNAGTFHVVLANEIGIFQAGFVAEIARTSQIWNQPVFAFDSQVQSESSEVYESAAPGTVKIVRMRTRMRYVSEVGPRWDALPMTDHPEQVASRTYEYTLELDDQDEILGGEWLTSDHPDFMWTQSAPTLTGYFAGLRRIYEAAVQ